MRAFVYLTLLATLLLAASCDSSKKGQALPCISFKEYLNHTDKITIGTDEIKHIEYIPLKLTDDDASLVGHIQDIVLTEDYIYVLTLEEFKVFQFDRQRKYVRIITRQGNGPGELQSVGRTMWTDEAGENIYISNGEGIQVFSPVGKFERQIKRGERLVSYAYGNGVDWVTEIATEYAPIDRSYFFGIGTFRYNADNSCDTLQLKKDFGDTSVVPLSETIFLNGRFMHWNPKTNIGVQTTSGATIAWMKEEGMIKNLPDCLKDYSEDGNPVVAIYHFK